MSDWVVAKFGGSSVKDAKAMLRCAGIVENDPRIKIVVISATQNTTNQLEFIARASERGDEQTLGSLINELIQRHIQIANELRASAAALRELNFLFDEMKFVANVILKDKRFTPKIMDQLYGLGERMSSLLVSEILRLQLASKKVILLDARNIIKTSSDYQKAEPQIDLIAELAHKILIPQIDGNTVVVTQGFIGKDLLNNTTTLGREGSDYSAALFGEAINALQVQIWTDVPGVATSDPRKIPEAKFIPQLSYDEATALAGLGAKVLFPTTLLPTKRKNIPVFVGSSLEPTALGTTITKNQDSSFKLKAVTLLSKLDFSLISFIGSHLDQSTNLVDDLKKCFGDIHLEFYDFTAVSVSFKILGEDPDKVLKKAHEILLAKG